MSSAAQVRELDRRTIEEIGVPGVALMEVASRGVAVAIRTHHHTEALQGVLVVCGPGNNGGDGYAVARWLHGWGYPVRTVSMTDSSSGDAGTMRDICRQLGIPDHEGLEGCGLLVDAVFGTGLSRELRGAALELVDQMDRHPAAVVAVDMPSGIDADTGQPHGTCVHAVRTVTFGRLKPGLLMAPGANCAGEIEVVDIGLDAARRGEPWAVAELPGAADLRPLWPTRTPTAHKGASGHLLVVAGSAQMAGAAVLACRGALRAGAGLVTLLTARGALPRLAAMPPEVMLLLEDGDALTGPPTADLARFDAILAGPGLGGGAPLSEGLAGWLGQQWQQDGRPMVFDADALGCVGEQAGGPRVITPHPGEAARMLGCTTADVQADRLTAARELASADRVALLKGPNTVIAGGGLPSFNATGGPVLATAGSGDVLAGVIGALLARGVPARDAARLAAWVHGAAGDRLQAARSGGWAAGDVAEAIPLAAQDLVESEP